MNIAYITNSTYPSSTAHANRIKSICTAVKGNENKITIIAPKSEKTEFARRVRDYLEVHTRIPRCSAVASLSNYKGAQPREHYSELLLLKP